MKNVEKLFIVKEAMGRAMLAGAGLGGGIGAGTADPGERMEGALKGALMGGGIGGGSVGLRRLLNPGAGKGIRPTITQHMQPDVDSIFSGGPTRYYAQGGMKGVPAQMAKSLGAMGVGGAAGGAGASELSEQIQRELELIKFRMQMGQQGGQDSWTGE